MKVLVLNASAYRGKSTTLYLTQKFLEGFGETAEVVHLYDERIQLCTACHSCWTRTLGECVQKDDAVKIMEKMKEADVILWSVPLYAYGAPAQCKALMDRMISTVSPFMYLDEDGKLQHEAMGERKEQKTILISTGGMPVVSGNFDGLLFQMRSMCGDDLAAICCAESALIKNPKTQGLVAPYIEAVKKAGAEYRAQGKISEETQKILDTPVMPAEQYVPMANKVFEAFVKKG